MTRISIIIPTLNEARALPELLELLQPWRRQGCEVIVVDGGSSDATLDVARRRADCVVAAGRGRAVQMNAGAARAEGEVLWFLHADTLPPCDGIQRIVEAVARGYGWGRFDVRLSGQGALLRVVEHLMNWRSRLTGIATGDQSLFVRSDWFHAEGGFPAIALMEDIAVSRLLKRRGRPAALRTRVVTSSRRWEQGGVLRTILLMWHLRLAYFLGADPNRLARDYQRG